MSIWKDLGLRFLKYLAGGVLGGPIGSALVSYDDNATGRASENDKWYTKVVKGFNNLFNPGHNWFDYQSWNDAGSALAAKTTGSALTPAEQAANQFNADEAQKQRDWEEYMSNTSYQRQVKDMQAAGVNPAMAMNGSSGASTPSGSAASSVAPQSGINFSDLMQLVMLPMQKKLMKAQAAMYQDQGKAALINAGANVQNAGTNSRNANTAERNASTQEYNSQTERYRAETDRMRAQIERDAARARINVDEANVGVLAEQAAYLKVQREQLPRQLDIAEKNADSQAKSAIAALRQADAAVQNAATNDRLADYETSLKYTQELLTWYQAEGQKVIAQNLPEKTRVEIDNMIKEGVKLDNQGRLINKQGHLVDAQTVKTYVNVGTDISGAINQWVNPFSKGPGASSAAGFDLSGAYQGVAYGYD